MYLYGRSFTIIADHKPLEMICNKPIAPAPPRLQRMLVKIHGYDYSVKYRPGNEMIMSDVLSCLPNPSERSEVQLDLRVDELSLDLVNFSSSSNNYVTKPVDARFSIRWLRLCTRDGQIKWLTYRLIFARSDHSEMNLASKTVSCLKESRK